MEVFTMKKAIKLVYIGIAAYNLYVAVDSFLQTPAGKKLKKKVKKVKEQAEPYLDETVQQAKEYAEKVSSKITG